MYPINIIGIGQSKSDLTEKQLNIIHACDLIVGGKRQLDLFDTTGKQTLQIKGHLSIIIDTIKEKADSHKIVVLASGDPLFHGIGSTLTQSFDKNDLIIHSNISSISAAFAAIKEPWHDAKIISLHGKSKQPFSFASLWKENKVAFLTDPIMDPVFIACELIKEGIININFCVLENIGHPTKQRIQWFNNLDTVRNQIFSHPNIVILKKNIDPHRVVSRETHIGMNDSLFKHSKGLITKSEVRSISLSKLKLIKKDHVLWDIGAGSGSVSVEAALQLPWGHVYSIENRPDRIPDIIQNIQNFNCSNVQVVNADFPDGIDELRPPDRIFIGGGGKGLEQIIDVACNKLRPYGVIVINTVLLQTLETSVRILEKNKFKPSAVQIQVSRSKAMPFGHRFEALNPVWIISGSKQAKKETTL
ncbi:MAG: precorrin-6y C5,15-methyltransferase (decarboxylating) subunit CbiE [Pseudomonadota bacterium]